MAWTVSSKKQSGGSATRTPVIVYSNSQNIGSDVADFTYTFTESGTFQYYLYVSTTISSSTIEVKFNNVAISPMISGTFAFGEITVNANDVLEIKTTFNASNCGAQIFIMKNADISRFSLIGASGNDNLTFNIPATSSPYLQVYKRSYYGSNNTYQYQIGIISNFQVFQDTEGRTARIDSIATPSTSAYYYGGTYAITI